MAFNITWNQFAQPNITGFYDAIVYFNSVTDDLFTASLMISFYMIFMLVFSRYGMKRAFSASSFIMFTLAGIFRAAGLVSNLFVVFFGIATAVSVFLISRN